ncbi:MAG: NUDIX domain-containing protein [Candidatus Levybacteria bacterium]|nr:NUDIX domain-containing protein [Candidatus Levybacteria bacterium]
MNTIKLQEGAVNAIILNENKEILFTERSLSDDFLPGYWELPGGGIDYGETPQEALIREIKEECGLGIEIIKPIAANSYFIKDIQRIEITFLCKAINSTKIKLSHEHSNYKWLKITEVNKIKVTDYIKKIIDSSIEST